MNFRGMYNNNKSMLIALTCTVAIDAVLTTLVICQRHDQNAVIDEASIRAAVPMSGARLPAGADIVATPNATTHPDPAATPYPADALVGSAFPAPGPSTPQAPTTPPLVAAAPQIITPPQQTPAAQKSFKPKIVTRRRVNPLPAPPPPAATPPLPAQITPTTPAKKPGAPPGF
jgi:hypothetical protein